MIAWIEKNGLRIGTFPALEVIAPALRVWFTTRVGGVSKPPFDSLNLGTHVGDDRSDVLENRRILKRSLGIGANRVARGGQVHGSDIAFVHRGGTYKRTDGFVTRSRELALAINSADCFPLIIHSPSEMVLAAVHVGRSGAAGGIIEKAFRILHERCRIDPRNTIAICGPGICPRCYEVGRDVAMGFPAYARKRRAKGWHLDLLRFIRTETDRAGVNPANFFVSGLCSACEGDLFSYRRAGGRTGRNWTLAMMTHP
jgi:YfiH family protein